MKSNCQVSICYLTIISSRKKTDKLLKALVEKGAQLVVTRYGKGTVDPNYLLDVFGLTPEEKKVVITCVIKQSKKQDFLEMLEKDFQFVKPNSGIAYITPIEEISY